MRRLSIAMVGLGDIAQKAYLPLVTQHQDITPILCTRNQAALSFLQSKYRIEQGYTEYQHLIASKPDAVMIHSHTSAHFEMAKMALESNIATFVDKPLADNLEQAETLIALAKQQNVPLFVGFNRRFAPKLKTASIEPMRHLRWQKNRNNLSAPARHFVFDDFIHVIDGLSYYAGVKSFSELNDWQVFSQKTPQGDIVAVHIQFTHKGRLFQGSMDRHSGRAEEVVEITGFNKKWRINALTDTLVMQDGESLGGGFDDWQSTLFKRGFDDMLSAWLKAIELDKADHEQLQQALLTHQLCEKVVSAIS